MKNLMFILPLLAVIFTFGTSASAATIMTSTGKRSAIQATSIFGPFSVVPILPQQANGGKPAPPPKPTPTPKPRIGPPKSSDE